MTTIYFNEKKQAFDFKIANCIAETDLDVWLKHCKNPTGTSWDIIDGKFKELFDDPEYIAEQKAKSKQVIKEKYRNIMDTYVCAKVKRDLYNTEEYQSMVTDMMNEIGAL